MGYWFVLEHFPRGMWLPIIASGVSAAGLATEILEARGVFVIAALTLFIFMGVSVSIKPVIPLSYHVVDGPLYPVHVGSFSVDVTNDNDRSVELSHFTIHVDMCPKGTKIGDCKELTSGSVNETVGIIKPHSVLRVTLNRPFIKSDIVIGPDDVEHDVFDVASDYVD